MRMLILVYVLWNLTNLAFAGSSICNSQDSMMADGEASNLRDWNSFYRSYKRFAQCDDGAISEGYSYSIAYLFIKKWSSIDELNSLMSKDKQFGEFVIHHVNEQVIQKEAIQIYSNVRSECPTSARNLCKQIKNRLDKTNREG